MSDKPTPAPPAIEVADLSKSFAAVRALDRVSARFRAGRVHALLGENGAGKSTLVKCLMGYYRADAGQILVDGHRRVMLHPRARACPRARHGLSAFHAGAADDRGGELPTRA